MLRTLQKSESYGTITDGHYYCLPTTWTQFGCDEIGSQTKLGAAQLVYNLGAHMAISHKEPTIGPIIADFCLSCIGFQLSCSIISSLV